MSGPMCPVRWFAMMEKGWPYSLFVQVPPIGTAPQSSVLAWPSPNVCPSS